MSGLAGKLSHLFEELRRRKVYRVVAAYAAFAFIVVQVADLVLPAFDSSDWVYRMIVILALIGFPLAGALAWIFEWTPGGVRVTAAVAEGRREEGLVRHNFPLSHGAGFRAGPGRNDPPDVVDL